MKNSSLGHLPGEIVGSRARGSCSFLLSAGAPFSGTSTSFGGPRFRSASLRLRRLAGCSRRRSLFSRSASRSGRTSSPCAGSLPGRRFSRSFATCRNRRPFATSGTLCLALRARGSRGASLLPSRAPLGGAWLPLFASESTNERPDCALCDLKRSVHICFGGVADRLLCTGCESGLVRFITFCLIVHSVLLSVSVNVIPSLGRGQGHGI